MRPADREELRLFLLRWALIALVLAVYAAVGNVDFADDLEREAMEKVAQPAREKLIEHPLPYTFSARDCLPSGRACSEPRYYVPTRHEETK